MLCGYYPSGFDLVAYPLLCLCIALLAAVPKCRALLHRRRRKKEDFGDADVRGRKFGVVIALLCLGVLFTLWRVWRFPPATKTTVRPRHLACSCQTFACLQRAYRQTDSESQDTIKNNSSRPTIFKVPHFWLGGCQKCGTTSMYGLLATHPQIVSPEPKEPGYFAWPRLVRIGYERWYIQEVLRLKEACDLGLDKVATFDATAYYLQWNARVAQNIRNSAPWAKAVFVFRDPVARAMSWLQHMSLKFPYLPNCLHYYDMNCCVQQDWFFSSDHHLHGSLYYFHLQSWLTQGGWSIDSMHFVQFEDIQKLGLSLVYADILAFLGLDTSPAHNLSAIERQPANRRSTKPYNISIHNYKAMVNYVRNDTYRLSQLLDRDFVWPRIWERQLHQCRRDHHDCRVDLLPPPVSLLPVLPLR